MKNNVKLKRFVAIGIDCFLIYCVLYTISIPQIIFRNDILDWITGIIDVFFIIFICPRKDCLFGYESIGKKIVGLHIYKDGKRVTDKKILIS